MNSDEIRAAIARLKAIPCDDTPFSLYSVAGAFMDMEMNGPYDSLGLRNRLIALLRQADPDTHVELPKDKDGKPWHIGDVMQWPDGVTGDVIGVGDGVLFYNDHDAAQWTAAGDKTHYRKPTFEDVVRDMLNDVVCTFDASGGCSAWMTDTKVHEYVDRFREVMADE